MKKLFLNACFLAMFSAITACNYFTDDRKIQQEVAKALAEQEKNQKAKDEASRDEMKRIAHDEAVRVAGERQALEDRVTRSMAGY